MNVASRGMTILTIGVVGGIFFTAVTHVDGLKTLIGGITGLYATAVQGTYGKA